MSRSTHHAQPGGPHGSLERRPLEDRDLRLARPRARRLRRRRPARARRTSTRTPPGPASRAAMDRILDAGFKQPAGESVLIQSRSLRRGHARLHAPRSTTSSRGVSKLAVVQHVRSPFAPGHAVSQGRALGARRVRDPRRQGQGRRQGRPGPRRPSPRPARPIPAFFIGEFGDASAVEGGRRPPSARTWRRPGCSRSRSRCHPRGRLRRARGGGHPAAARAHGRLRDVRAGRAAEPPAAADAAGARRRAPDRARGRRRLLDVLPPARARGARAPGAASARRSRPPPRPPAARCSISGLTVMVAMAGMFLTGDATVRLVRRRDDHRRRRRRARLADRPAGAALEARRQRRPAARPVRRPAPPRRRRGPDLGRDRRPRPAAARCSRRVLAGGRAARARRAGAPAPHGQRRARTPSRSRSPVVKTYDRMQQAFPGTALPANVVVKAPNVNAPAVRARDRAGSSSGRSRAAGCTSRSRSTSTRPAPSRTSPSRSRAREPTPQSNASLAALRDEIVPQTVGALPNTRGRRHRADGRSGRTPATS